MEPEKAKEPTVTSSRKPGVKICPRCGSMDVDATTGTGFVSPPLYVCNRCGYAGSIFPELDKEDAIRYAQSGKGEAEGNDWADEVQEVEDEDKEEE